MIRLRLLGNIGLTGAAGEELGSVLTQQKRFAVLVYLALSSKPTFHSRDKLFGLFWPELSAERARAALNQSLYFLRRELGENILLSRGRDYIGIDHDQIDCDTVKFDKAMAEGDATTAVELYRGDLLSGAYLVDTVDWEDWLCAERHRLRKLAAEAAWQCCREAEERNDRAGAMHWAARALEWSDYDEPGFRTYLELLGRFGDRAGALRAFRSFSERMEREYGVEVMPETRRIIENISACAEPEPSKDETKSTTIADVGPVHELHEQHTWTGRWVRRSITIPAGLAALVLVAFLLAGPRIKERIRDAPAGESPVTTKESGALDPETQKLYLRGRHLLSSGDAASSAEARALFEQALEIDPEYANAWSGLADSFINLAYFHGLPQGAAFPRARGAAERALEINPDLAEAHASLATVLTRYYWDSTAAERHFLRSLELAPYDAETLSSYSSHLRNHRRFAEARVMAERALALDPLAFSTNFDLVVLDLMEGQYDLAAEALRNMIAVNPENRMAHFMLARVLAQAGDYAAALEILDKLKGPEEPIPFLTIRGFVLGKSGRTEEAREVLQTLSEKGNGAFAFDEAIIQLGLEDRDKSLVALERALEQHDSRMRLLLGEPIFDPLRGDSRFESLLERAGLGR